VLTGMFLLGTLVAIGLPTVAAFMGTIGKRNSKCTQV
jgi:hypothetical protein